jgi:anti-sigma regulatory factor (Ser/Thr protein kinase)
LRPESPPVDGWLVASHGETALFRQSAERAGFQCHPLAPPNGAGLRLTVGAAVAADPLPALLALPLHLCVEAGLEPAVTPPDADPLALLVSSRTAFTADPGTAFATALLNRGLITAHRMEAIRLCLHEAIANAVIHGNFGIAGGDATSPRQFLEDAARLEQRLADPRFAARPIVIAAAWDDDVLSLRVSDVGAGFTAAAARPGHRGLTLILANSQRCWHEDGGRVIVMQFAREADHAADR